MENIDKETEDQSSENFSREYDSKEADYTLRELISNIKGQIDFLYFGGIDDSTEEIIFSYLNTLKKSTDDFYTIMNDAILEKANSINDLNKNLNISNCKLQENNIIINDLYLETQKEKKKSDHLLLNILPAEVADELKERGEVKPKCYELITVMFTDFVGFTNISEKLTPEKLIKELDGCFIQFDNICEHYHLEKIKTIGDSYMAAGGVPASNISNPVDACLASLEICNFMDMMKDLKQDAGIPFWELRIGIHSGPAIAGIVGKNKFQFDIWGDSVNIASRMESSGEACRINLSAVTYELIKDFFDCEYRGKVMAKRKGDVDMYFLNHILPELSENREGLVPNDHFMELYKKRFS